MSILTPKMALARKENVPASCVMWFPCAEGSGNDIADVVGGIILTDNATAGHDVPHAIEFVHTGDIETGVAPSLAAGKSVVMLDVVIPGTLGSAGGATNLIGDSTNAYIGIQSTGFGVKKEGQTATIAAFQTLTATEKFVRVGTFNGATGLISSYSGNDGSACAADNTANGAVHVGGISLSDTWLMGDVGVGDGKVYGSLWIYCDTLPDEDTLLAAADWAYVNWTNGVKLFPPQLKDVA